MSSFSILGNDKGRSIAPLILFDLIKEVGLALDELKGAGELELNRLLDSNKTANAKNSKTNTQQESQKAIHIVTLLEYISKYHFDTSGSNAAKIRAHLELFEKNRAWQDIVKLREIIRLNSGDLLNQIADRMVSMNFSPDITFTLNELEMIGRKDFHCDRIKGKGNELFNAYKKYSNTQGTANINNKDSKTNAQQESQNTESKADLLPTIGILGATTVMSTVGIEGTVQVLEKIANIFTKNSKTNAQQESQNTESKADSNKQPTNEKEQLDFNRPWDNPFMDFDKPSIESKPPQDLSPNDLDTEYKGDSVDTLSNILQDIESKIDSNKQPQIHLLLKLLHNNLHTLPDLEKIANINTKDSKTNAQQESQNTESKADSNKQGEINTDTLINYTFTLDDNIMKDIEPKLSESFELGIDIEQSTHKLFNQFENILIKNDDYNTYTTEQKQIVTNLANIHKEVNKILLHFNDVIATNQGGLSPMQAKRFYIRSINQFIDSMKSINKDTIQPTKRTRKAR